MKDAKPKTIQDFLDNYKPQRVEDTIEYKNAVKESNKKIDEHQREYDRNVIESSKHVYQ